MSLQGQIEETGLGPIIQTLSLNRYRGTLRIETEGGSQFFFISEGEIVLVRQVKQDPVRLGDLLVAAGHLSDDQLDDALEQQRQNTQGRRLGETIVELGLVTQEQIEQAVRGKFEEDFLDLFLLDQGRFEFIFGLTPEALFGPDERLERITLSTSSLMMEAMRRVDEWQGMISDLGSFETIFRNRLQSMATPIEEYDFEGVTLPKQTRSEIYDLLTGDRSLREVISAALEGGVATRLQTFLFLHALQANELIKPLDFKALLASAKDALSRGDVSGAAKYIRAILGRKERIDLALVQRYLLFLEEQQRPRLAFEEARRFAAQSLADDENDAAITLYERALSLYVSVEVIDRLFYTLLRTNQRARAVEVGLELRDYLQSDSDLAVAQRIVHNLQELDPDNPGVVELRGLVLKRLERNEEAIEVLDRALVALPDDHPRRPKVIAALLELAPDRDDLRSAQDFLELQEARQQVIRERRLRWIGIGATLLFVFLIWRGYAEWSARALLGKAEAILEETGEAAEVSDLNRVTVLLSGVQSFTTVSGTAADLAEQVRERTKAQERETRLRVDELIRRRQAEAKAAEEARKRREDREALRAALTDFRGLVGKRAFQEASAKAVAIAKRWPEVDDPELAREKARLRVFAQLTSEPAGASILLEGETVGKTPYVVGVPLDSKVTVRVRLAGYHTELLELDGKTYLEKRYVLRPGETWKVSLRGEPEVLCASPRGPLVAFADGGLSLRRISDGEPGWQITLPGSGPVQGVAVAENLAVVVRGRVVLGVGLAKGQILWQRELRGTEPLLPPAVGRAAGQPIALVAGQRSLFLIEVAGGTPILELNKLPEQALHEPLCMEGWGYVALADRVVGFSLSQPGARRQDWASLPKATRWERPVVATGPLLGLPASDAVVARLEGGQLRVLERRQGVTTPVAPAIGPLVGVAPVRGSIYCLGSNGQLASFRSDGLEVLAPKPILSAASAGPILVGDELVTVDRKGRVARFSLSGRRREEAEPIQLGAPASRPLVQQGAGALILVGRDLRFLEPQEER